MTAAAFKLAPAPTVDEAKFIAIDQAAERLQRDDGYLRRLCNGTLAAQGIAMIATPPDGGQASWYIRRDYDPRLIAGTIGELYAEPDLSRYPSRQRDEALARRACVIEFRAARTSSLEPVRDWLPRFLDRLRDKFGLKRLKRSALYKWEKLYQRPVDLVKLIDVRGGNRRGKNDPAAWQAFRDLYLHENRPSVKQCHSEVKRLAALNRWQWSSYDSCVRQLDDRICPQDQMRVREPMRYRQQMAPFIQQAPESWRANELWISDHKQLDLICWWNSAKIRPWLTTWMDWRTRKIVGWILSDNPNSTTILGALRHGLKEPANCGGPRCVWIDNGKDYSAWLFHGQTKKQRRERIAVVIDEPRTFGIFAMLKIEAHFATPYNPNGKARLERWFRTLESFCKTFATYTGDGPDTKPEQLNEILENPRSIPTFKEVETRIADHIAGNNGRNDHAIDDLIEAGERLSPNEAMARWCDTRRIIDEKSLDLLMVNWHRPVTVARNGITITLAGESLHYGQYCPELRRFKARFKADRKAVVVAYDPHDLRSIRVHDEHFNFVCEAPMNGIGGAHGDAISIAHIAEMNRQKATYSRAEKEITDHRLTRILSTEEHAADVAAQQAEARRPAPTALQIVPTPMDGQADEMDRARFRKAVGDGTPAPTRRQSALDKLMHDPEPRQPVPASRPQRDVWAKARGEEMELQNAD